MCKFIPNGNGFLIISVIKGRFWSQKYSFYSLFVIIHPSNRFFSKFYAPVHGHWQYKWKYFHDHNSLGAIKRKKKLRFLMEIIYLTRQFFTEYDFSKTLYIQAFLSQYLMRGLIPKLKCSSYIVAWNHVCHKLMSFKVFTFVSSVDSSLFTDLSHQENTPVSKTFLHYICFGFK